MDKKIIVGLSILGFFYLLFRVFSYILIPYFIVELTPQAYDEMELIKIKLGTLEMFFNYGFNLICGVFLYIQSRKNRQIEYHLIWLFLGGMFGIGAIVLFYIYMIYLKLYKNNLEGE